MAEPRDIPSARAVGGAEGPPGAVERRWLTRTAVVFDQAVTVALANQCACCRQRLDGDRGSEYCARCVRHQRGYRLLVAAAFVGLAWVGMHARDVAFDLAPFAGTWAHVALAFALGLAGPAVFVLALSLARAPGHGHWGHAVDHRSGEGSASRSVFRNAGYGRALAGELGVADEVREVREPRAGWRVIAVFLTIVPLLSAAAAFLGYDDTRFTLYVDNGTDRELRIAVDGGGEVARVPAMQHLAVTLPRTAMTLVAADAAGGGDLERLSVGGLEEILAGDYPDTLYPDVEYDTGDRFMWNVLRRRCYQATTHMYGTIGLGGEPTVHREKAFVVEADEPFEAAPQVVKSSIGVDVRDELLRQPCE